ncbi:MAG TPA: caspase family protein [Polyangia bacterium]|nr:caspase family protein [Polyangia bacterium]
MSLRLLGACLILALGQGAARAQTEQTRVAVVVGNNLGHDPGRTLRYAEAEAGKLASLLRGAGDFDSVVTVTGASRERVEVALATARTQLDRAHADGKRTLFLFYYSGHGDREALELGSSRLPLRDLRSYLEQLTGADVRVAFVDACQSGALTGVKGGRRAPGYEIHLADPGSVRGMAIVTSSTANELSQESDDLQGSFFTHNFMAGLRGAADSSRDGQVTLGEVYQFAFRRTLASTAASLVGGQHPTYDYRMSGAGDVILSRTRPNDARLVFPREAGATYTVVHKGRGEVIAELASTAGEDFYLALPAGEYRVVRRALASVSETTFSLPAGSSTAIETTTMSPVVADADNHRKKGGLWQPNSLGVHFGLQNSPVSGTGMVGALSYSRQIGRLALRVRGEFSSSDAKLQDYQSSFLRVALSLDGLWPLYQADRLALLLGPTMGVPLVRQHDIWHDSTYSVGLNYGVAASAMFRSYRSTWLVLSLQGGGELFRLNSQLVQRLTGGVSLGGLVAF